MYIKLTLPCDMSHHFKSRVYLKVGGLGPRPDQSLAAGKSLAFHRSSLIYGDVATKCINNFRAEAETNRDASRNVLSESFMLQYIRSDHGLGVSTIRHGSSCIEHGSAQRQAPVTHSGRCRTLWYVVGLKHKANYHPLIIIRCYSNLFIHISREQVDSYEKFGLLPEGLLFK